MLRSSGLNHILLSSKLFALSFFFCFFAFGLFSFDFSGTSTHLLSTVSAVGPSEPQLANYLDCGVLEEGSVAQCIFNKALFLPARFFAFFIGWSVSIIQISTDAIVLEELFNLSSLYTTWGIVRDFFNIIFIFVLLFSAFATIFQVQKYHLKSIILKVVLMAILINFSWPITRVIIDLSNVLMFFFLDGQNGVGLMAEIGKASKFAELAIYQEGGNIGNSDQSMKILLVNVFTFIFAVTMLTVALQLFIRTAVLMVLMIFSPIGIAGAAVPRLQSLSSQWWDSLIKYAFVGPISIFMLIFALSTMLIMNDVDSSFTQQAGKAASNAATSGWRQQTALAIQYSVPIIILWAGVIASGKLSDKASDFVRSTVSKQMNRIPRATGRFAGRGAKGLAKKSGKGTLRLADRATGRRVSTSLALRKQNKDAAKKQREADEKDRVKIAEERQLAKRNLKNANKESYVAQNGKIMGRVPLLRGRGVDPEANVNAQIVTDRDYKKEVKEKSKEVGSMDPNDLRRLIRGESVADEHSFQNVSAEVSNDYTVVQNFKRGVGNVSGEDFKKAQKRLEDIARESLRTGAKKKAQEDYQMRVAEKIASNEDPIPTPEKG